MGDELAAASHGLPSCAGSQPAEDTWRRAVIYVVRNALNGTDLKQLLQALGLIPNDGSAP